MTKPPGSRLAVLFAILASVVSNSAWSQVADDEFDVIPAIAAGVAARTPKVSLNAVTPNPATGGATVMLSASVTLAAGDTLTSVKYYQGSTLIGSGDPLNQWKLSWTPPVGTYSLTATATNNLKLTGKSAAQAFVVTTCTAPSATLTVNPSGSAYVGTNIALGTSYTSGAGICPVTSVTIKVDGVAKGIFSPPTSSPVTVSWTPIAAQTYSITTEVADGVHALITPPPVSFTAISTGGGGGNQAPTVSVAPATAQSTVNTAILLTATITDPGDSSWQSTCGSACGTVALFNGSTQVAQGTFQSNSVFTISWAPPAAQTYSLTVRATDSGGMSGTGTTVLTGVAGGGGTAPNADAVIPPSYVTPAIGTLGGTFNVDDRGAAKYTIPIPVPPGTAGLQPALSLTYSSNSGQGHLGVGWRLAGLSAISRCPKTLEQDTTVRGITYDKDNTNDAYCLDGQRLVAVGAAQAVTDNNFRADPNGLAAWRTEYRTELDTYSRVEMYEERSPGGNRLLWGPYRWRVWTKAGQIFDYGSRWWIKTAGYTQATSLRTPEQDRENAAVRWVLDRVIDSAGNFMEIDYADRAQEAGVNDPAFNLNVQHLPTNCGTAAPGYAYQTTPQPIGALPNVEYWPTAIRYYSKGEAASECSGDASPNWVKLTYKDIPSQSVPANRDRYYDAGAGQTTISKRLVEIVTSINGTNTAPSSQASDRASTLRLEYLQSPQSQQNLLRSIQHCGSDNVCLPATQFEYASETWQSPSTSRFLPANYSGLKFTVDRNASGNNGVFVADWNGDGKSDLIGWAHDYTATPNWYSHKLYVCLSNGSSAPTPFTCGDTPILSFEDGNAGTSSDATLRVDIMDIDGDGRADLMWVPTYSTNPTPGSKAWTACISNGQTGCTQVTGGSWLTAPQHQGNPSFRGDINGDGRIDIITYDKSQSGMWFETCLSSAAGFPNPCAQQNLALGYSPCGADPNCEEFNGNSITEIVVADANGDGRADLIMRKSANVGEEKWKVCFSDFGASNTYICHDRFVKGSNVRASNTVSFDFNGDGLADLASPLNLQSDDGWWKICLSTGDGAFEFEDPNVRWSNVIAPDNHSGWVNSGGIEVDFYAAARCRVWKGPKGLGEVSNNKQIFGDFNGDGRTDIAAYDKNVVVAGASQNGAWRVCLSTGSAFATEKDGQNNDVCPVWGGPQIPIGSDDPDLNQWVVSGDFNGDGKTDLVVMYATGEAIPVFRGQVGYMVAPVGDVLSAVTTGLGARTTIAYAPLTDGSVYAKSATEGPGPTLQEQELDIQSPMYVVKATFESNGVGGTFDTGYFYENLRGRPTGRGLYGFRKITKTEANGAVVESRFDRPEATSFKSKWPLFGQLTSLATRSANSVGAMQLVNRTTNTYETRESKSCAGVLCGGTPKVLESNLSIAFVERFELDGTALPTVTTETLIGSLNDVGSVLTTSTVTSDNYRTRVDTTYFDPVWSTWVIGRAKVANSTLSKPGDPATVFRTMSYTYHGLSNASCHDTSTTIAEVAVGTPCSETIEPTATDGRRLAKAYLYNAKGHRTSETATFYDSGEQKSRQITTQLDSRGRFPVALTSYNGATTYTESRTYDARWGLVTESIAPNATRAQTLLDGFGRVYGERSRDTDNNRVSERFTALEGGAPYGPYRVRVLQSGGAESFTYFDALQRSIRSQEKAFNQNAYAESTTTYDALGRKWKITTPKVGSTMLTELAYDSLGRVKSETVTRGALAKTTTRSFTAFSTLTVDGAVVTGGLKTVSEENGTGASAVRTSTQYTNSVGKVVQLVDPEGGVTSFVYDAAGNLTKSKTPQGISESIEYDVRGRKTKLISPDAGTWVYEYNGMGEVVRQTDGRSPAFVTRNYYDGLGRVVERREFYGTDSVTTNAFVTVNTYEAYADGATCARGVGKLCEVRTKETTRAAGIVPGSVLSLPTTQKRFTFDTAGRTDSERTKVAPSSTEYETKTTYDRNGRVERMTYPGGFALVYHYTDWSGQLDQISTWNGSGTGSLHWRANTRYGDGLLESMTVGSLTTTRSYDDFGRPTAISTNSGVQDAIYGFDVFGNLTQRRGPETNADQQTLEYDRLNRLKKVGAVALSYSADGNLISGPSGTNTYGLSGTHRLTSAGSYSYGYDGNGNVLTIALGNRANSPTTTMTYAPFNLPSSIVTTNTTPAGSVTYVYDERHQRIKEVSTGAPVSGTTTSSGTTIYLGDFEEHTRPDNVVERRHYIRTPDGTVGVHTTDINNVAVSSRYWHRDHLGSPAVITDAAGTVKQRFTFDPWGKRTQLGSLAVGEPYAEERGFTGHEHMPEVGLIHMNGRLYDPLAGRFMQADPIIQEPLNGQNYNRYSYVVNNPLSLTDPSGFSFWTKWRKPILVAAAAAAGQIAGAAIAFEGLTAGLSGLELSLAAPAATATADAVGAMAGGFAAGGIAGGNVESAVQGAIFASFSFAIGTATTGKTSLFGSYNPQANVALHSALGCAQQAAAGGSCRAGAMAGGFSAAASPWISETGTGVVGAMAVGAVASKLGGGSYQDGAITAAFGYLFNECIHGTCTSTVEQALYDWWPGYKAGTLLYNQVWGSGGWTGWEALDVASVGLGIAGKGAQMLGALGTVGREIQLVDGFYQVQGSFRIKAWYYEHLMATGRPAPFLQAQEVLQTATTIASDRMAGFYRYTNNVMEMVYNPTTREIWHLNRLGK